MNFSPCCAAATSSRKPIRISGQSRPGIGTSSWRGVADPTAWQLLKAAKVDDLRERAIDRNVLCTGRITRRGLHEEEPSHKAHTRKGGRVHYAACHGTAARGDGPAAPALKTVPADLTRLSARNGGKFPEARVRRYIEGLDEISAHGSRDMPVWGRRCVECREGTPGSGCALKASRGTSSRCSKSKAAVGLAPPLASPTD
jgi:hypothetical protein